MMHKVERRTVRNKLLEGRGPHRRGEIGCGMYSSLRVRGRKTVRCIQMLKRSFFLTVHGFRLIHSVSWETRLLAKNEGGQGGVCDLRKQDQCEILAFDRGE